MTVNRSGNPARTTIPDYKPSRPVNATPTKGTGWAGYGASTRQRTEAARSHVDRSVGDKWQTRVNKPTNAPGGRAAASAPPESPRPQVEAKSTDKPTREVFKRAADAGRASGTAKLNDREELVKSTLIARTQAEEASSSLAESSEDEQVDGAQAPGKSPVPAPLSPKAEILAAVQKLVNEKYGDTRSPVYVQGLVYERQKDPDRIELSGLVIVKKSVSEKLAKQHNNDPDGLSAALEELGSAKTKVLKFSDAADWKNTRLFAAIKKQGGNLQALFKNMAAASASIQASHAPSFARQAMQLMLKRDLKTEGLFRIAAGDRELMETQCRLVTAPDLEAALPPRVHVMTPPDILKRVLREMPQRIISGANKTEFLALSGIDNADSGKLQAYRQAVDKLAAADKELLGTLMRFLKIVAAQAEHNKMHARNLGMVFSMVILEPEIDPQNIVTVRSTFEPVVAYMIEHANELFPDPDAATPSPKKAALGQVKGNAGPAMVASIRSTNIDGAESTESTESTTVPTTSKASVPRTLKQRNRKQDATAPNQSPALKAEKASNDKRAYPNASLQNAQSAMDAANFIMTHAAQELGEDWRWEPDNSPLRALVQGGIGNLRANKQKDLFWTSREDFLQKADQGQLQTWLKDAIADVKKLKMAAEQAEQDPQAAKSDVATAQTTYRTALARLKTNQLDFTVLYAAEALTKGMAGKSIETLNEVVNGFGKRNPDGTPMPAFDKFSPQEQQCLYDFFSSLKSLLQGIEQRAAPGKGRILTVAALVNNLYLFAFAPLGETDSTYLDKATRHALSNNQKPMAAHIAAQKTQAIAIGLLTDPAKYFPKALTV
jgi:hypothetical protein